MGRVELQSFGRFMRREIGMCLVQRRMVPSWIPSSRPILALDQRFWRSSTARACMAASAEGENLSLRRGAICKSL